MKFKYAVVLLVISTSILSGCSLFKKKPEPSTPNQTQKIQRPVNQIPIDQRPYVELVPLSGRNKLNLVIHDRKLEATSVEMSLEYDRNQGVLDAVLKNFPLTKNPQTEEVFLGSKSAGGHTTYHDDVIGGALTLTFDGENPYALEVPWRYDDKQKQYDQFSTSDGKFQINFSKPISTSKILVMQSPGYPDSVKGEVVAGPYLVRIDGQLPTVNVDLQIRLSEPKPDAKLMGWDGEAWKELPSTINDKTLTSSTDMMELYLVTN